MSIAIGIGIKLSKNYTSSAPVAPAAQFTMTQLASPNRVYQRSTSTGGGQSKGAGTIPVTLSAVTTAGTIYARCRSAADGVTILQAPWLATTLGATGAQTASISGVDARLGWFYLDLSGDGSTWTNGTTAVGMGRVVAFAGQSLAVRMVHKRDSGGADAGTTLATLGITPSTNGVVYAQADTVPATPTWSVPSDAGPYKSAFAANFLNKQIIAAGVNCAFVGFAVGSTSISTYIPGGGNNASLRSILDAAGGFEGFIWYQGHTDAVNLVLGSTYYSHLTLLFNDITSRNAVKGSTYTKMMGSIPNIVSTSWGTLRDNKEIRAASRIWAEDNGAHLVEAHDLDLTDGVHQSQEGSLTLSNHFHRASRVGLSLAGDDTGPRITSSSRPAGSAVITLNCTMPTGATSLVAVGTIKNKFRAYDPATNTPLTINTVTVSGSQIIVTLSAAPADDKDVTIAFCEPFDSTNTGQTDMVYDNHTDGDGITNGRQLHPTIERHIVVAPNFVSSQLRGVNLTPNSMVYGTAPSGWNQMRTAGTATSPLANGSDVLPQNSAWGLTMRFRHSTSLPSGIECLFGLGDRIYVGIDSSGTLASNVVDPSSPNLCDGNWHTLAVVANHEGSFRFFIDAERLGFDYGIPSGGGSGNFTIGGFIGNPSYVFNGDIDEVVIWRTSPHTSYYRVPTTPAVGNEPGLRAVYHLDSNTNTVTA